MENPSKKIPITPLLSILLALFLTLGMFPIPSHAAFNDEVNFKSEIVYMENLDQGTVVFNKNATKKTAMASMTKITTAMVVLENVKNLDTVVTAKQSVLDTLSGTNSSNAGIVAGEQLTVRQLLNLMMVHSANESAAILADYVGGGDMSKFIDMMNAYAKKLGCKNTHYVNPHGLDAPDHYTTAKDLATVAKKALENDLFKTIVGQASYTLPDTNKRSSISYTNTNQLINKHSKYYYEPCKGIKTGTTENAGQCLISYATQNGYTYLCVVIGGADLYASTSHESNQAFLDTLSAYKWAFNNLKLKVVASPNDIVSVADIKLARKVDTVQLVPSTEVSAILPVDVDSSGIAINVVDGSIDPDLHAPLKAGEVVGKANILYAGDKLATIDLVSATDVHRSFFGTIWYCISTLFHFLVVKIVVVVAVLFALAYYLIHKLRKKNERKRNVQMVHARPNAKGKGQPISTVSYQRKSNQPNRKKRRR